LPISRGDTWQVGRLVRTGLTFILGTNLGGNETHTFPVEKLPDGAEVKVEYSVITGPAIHLDTEGAYYHLSSWSHSCPVVDTSGNLFAEVFPSGNGDVQLDKDISTASGCLIDAHLKCNDIFPQDDRYFRNMSAGEPPWCIFTSFSVTMLAGIDIDPLMLAAYAGIATRNEGLNNYNLLLKNHHIAINSIAAAFIMTREIVNGTIAVDGVRAIVGPGYVGCMVLPLVLLVPLFFFPLVFCIKKEKMPPVPKSTWDLMVLSRGETEAVPQLDRADSAFPPYSTNVKYGIAVDDGNGFDHLGLGKGSFRSLTESEPLSVTASPTHDNNETMVFSSRDPLESIAV